MSIREAVRELPRPGIIPAGIGAHFACFRADDIMIKVAKLRSGLLLDDICYELIKATIPHQYLVEQSMASVSLRARGIPFASKEVLLQPFVPGINVGRMLFESTTIFGKEEVSVYPEYRDSFALVAPALRGLLYNPNIDPRPSNFIATPEGSLVYIDYQMPLICPRSEECRSILDRLLKREGFL